MVFIFTVLNASTLRRMIELMMRKAGASPLAPRFGNKNDDADAEDKENKPEDSTKDRQEERKGS
jgi:hypothetical protein